ncbi:DUF6932 family protein [Pontibacter sp. MBLB2868]|uniref:DUF6932 family protein n=1 Tax=Pontibacter sp. MBLB2868 TaxID=3451555 RepID=UPI003F7535B2
MIPPFTADGLLPPGIHWATWIEIQERFGYTSYRSNLLFGMMIGIESLKKSGCTELYIDGSFCTDKLVPGDFDACYEDANIDWALLQKIDPTMLEFSNGRAAQKLKYYGEFFPYSAIADRTTGKMFLEFFQVQKYTNIAKGIVGLKL